jgi:hypothetical protein
MAGRAGGCPSWETRLLAVGSFSKEVCLAQQDKVADALTAGLAATLGATVLAVPWFGFLPLAVACTGVAVAVAYAKAANGKYGR